jgi:hypothetical protein
MTSAAQDGAAQNPSGLVPDAAEVAISSALASLDDLRELPVSEHVERFEAVHSALIDALNSAEGARSASSDHGS